MWYISIIMWYIKTKNNSYFTDTKKKKQFKKSGENVQSMISVSENVEMWMEDIQSIKSEMFCKLKSIFRKAIGVLELYLWANCCHGCGWGFSQWHKCQRHNAADGSRDASSESLLKTSVNCFLHAGAVAKNHFDLSGNQQHQIYSVWTPRSLHI